MRTDYGKVHIMSYSQAAAWYRINGSDVQTWVDYEKEEIIISWPRGKKIVPLESYNAHEGDMESFTKSIVPISETT